MKKRNLQLTVQHIKPEFSDERGFISRIMDQDKYPIRAILYIKRKKGSVGANHYHKKDAHYVYVLEGKVKRSEIDLKKKNVKKSTVILLPGDLILTPPMTAHVDEFLEDSVILAFTTENRSSKSYERDTVRTDVLKK